MNANILLDNENPVINRLEENIRASMIMPINERQPLRKLFKNQKFRKVLQTVNNALPRLIHRDASLTEINQVHYVAAITVQETIFSNKPPSGNRINQRNQPPAWKQKLSK